jgi:hypothetical protein
MADRVGLKHRLMKQAAEEMEKQMDQQRKVEEAMKGWPIARYPFVDASY